MLYVTLCLGILILICAALTINNAWTQANAWIVPLGVVCVVIGALMETLRFQHAKGVTQNKKRPYTLPPEIRAQPCRRDACRCSWRQASLCLA